MRLPSIRLPALGARTGGLAGLAALGVLAFFAISSSSQFLEARQEIAQSRELLDRVRLNSRLTAPSPLWATDEGALSAAFRSRINDLANGRAVVVEDIVLEHDAGRPGAPWLKATLRGTTQGLHDLLLALETSRPFIVIETADIAIVRSADVALDQPTLLRSTISARGFVGSAGIARPNDTVNRVTAQ